MGCVVDPELKLIWCNFTVEDHITSQKEVKFLQLNTECSQLFHSRYPACARY